MNRLYNYVNILSIDVALGSVCAALFFAHYEDVSISLISLPVLALTVWIIYTVDHLMDAKKIVGAASSERHRFHQQNFILLRSVVAMAMLLVGILLFFLPGALLFNGAVLSAGVVAYLLFHSFVPYLKELVVALIYTAGVFLPSSVSLEIPEYPIFLLISFFCVAYINLLAFSWFSESEDRRDGISSLATMAGPLLLRLTIALLLLIQGMLLIRSEFKLSFVILFVMSCVLSGMFVFSHFFKVGDRYRFGDAVFFITLFYLFL